jgi:hypothetical protein
MMWNMFLVGANIIPAPEKLELSTSLPQSMACIVDAAGYLSDWLDEEDIDEDDSENSRLTTDASADGDNTNLELEITASNVARPRKRQRLDVPYCKQHKEK